MNNNDPNYEQRIADEEVMQEQLENTHAIIAANRNDVCPKLLSTEVDTHHIVRKNEHLPPEYCNYYLYPKVGERIAVTTDNSDLEVILISPHIHNFKNGSVIADKHEKHIIRVQYNGITKQPKYLSYNIEITVS